MTEPIDPKNHVLPSRERIREDLATLEAQGYKDIRHALNNADPYLVERILSVARTYATEETVARPVPAEFVEHLGIPPLPSRMQAMRDLRADIANTTGNGGLHVSPSGREVITRALAVYRAYAWYQLLDRDSVRDAADADAEEQRRLRKKKIKQLRREIAYQVSVIKDRDAEIAGFRREASVQEKEIERLRNDNILLRLSRSQPRPTVNVEGNLGDAGPEVVVPVSSAPKGFARGGIIGTPRPDRSGELVAIISQLTEMVARLTSERGQ